MILNPIFPTAAAVAPAEAAALGGVAPNGAPAFAEAFHPIDRGPAA